MTHARHVAAGERGRPVSLPRLLFAFLGAPVLWISHLSVVYFLLTLDCISDWNGGGWSIAVATILFAAASAASGWTAWSMYRGLGGEDPAEGEREWARFLLVLGIGGGMLFTAVIILEGLSPAFVDLCA